MEQTREELNKLGPGVAVRRVRCELSCFDVERGMLAAPWRGNIQIFCRSAAAKIAGIMLAAERLDYSQPGPGAKSGTETFANTSRRPRYLVDPSGGTLAGSRKTHMSWPEIYLTELPGNMKRWVVNGPSAWQFVHGQHG